MENEDGGNDAPPGRLTFEEAVELWHSRMEEAQPFAVALGERLRAVREEQGLSTEQIADWARMFGLTWHRTTVGQTERGKRALTAVELLLLPVIYHRSLRDLLPQPQEADIWLTDEAALSGWELHRYLDKGYDPNKTGFRTPGTLTTRAELERHRLPLDEKLAEAREFANRMQRHLLESARRWPRDLPVAHLAKPDEAETKAAKRLGTTPEYVAATARELWGHGLATERDTRMEGRSDAPATPRALQAARGHITRTLIEEMAPRIREHEARRSEADDEGGTDGPSVD